MATDLKTNFLFEFQVLIAKSNAEDWSTDDKEEYSADDDKEVTLSVLEERKADSFKKRRRDSSKYEDKKNDGEYKQDSMTGIRVEGWEQWCKGAQTCSRRPSS